MQNRAATISKYKMINVDDHTNKNKKEHGHMAIYFRSSIRNINSKRSEKNALLDLIIHRPKIDTIYLYAKDPYGEKYQFLISKRNKMILNLLWNAQMTCKMYIKIANIIIQKKKTKY